MSPQGFSRDPPETLKVKEWFASIRFDLQRQVVVFLLWAYGFLLLTTMAILFLQGFHAWGFTLDRDLLKWLGGATVGEIGGLLFLTFEPPSAEALIEEITILGLFRSRSGPRVKPRRLL